MSKQKVSFTSQREEKVMSKQKVSFTSQRVEKGISISGNSSKKVEATSRQ